VAASVSNVWTCAKIRHKHFCVWQIIITVHLTVMIQTARHWEMSLVCQRSGGQFRCGYNCSTQTAREEFVNGHFRHVGNPRSEHQHWMEQSGRSVNMPTHIRCPQPQAQQHAEEPRHRPEQEVTIFTCQSLLLTNYQLRSHSKQFPAFLMKLYAVITNLKTSHHSSLSEPDQSTPNPLILFI